MRCLLNYPKLFEPLQVGELSLRNRIVMAPMTRSRATDDDRVTELHRLYYQQRANAGLIVTEGVHPSANGKGYNRTPGIYSAQQVDDWRVVTDAVHGEGGLIACQLMHCGRVGHADNKATGTEFLAPSAIAARAEIFTEAGMKPMPVPRAMTLEDIKTVVDEYRQATENCLAAGFDGVELHAASGYLPAQFLASESNLRDDEYGGSIENRLRFIREVLTAMIDVAGPGRVGLRISPGNPYNDHVDATPEDTYGALLDLADSLQLAWVHAIRMPSTGIDSLQLTRNHYRGVLIGSDSFDAAEADSCIANGSVDAVSFGRAYIANPDLAQRFAADASLNKMDKKTIYAGTGAPGYTDYPTMDAGA